ncbi:MAG: GNAT family N-acetyltransferase [Ignavibacteriales bacterium]|nr:GNAT family N-acetyltransferase [Ignavibacteriales bacterium]
MKQPIREYHQDEFTISTDPVKLQIDVIHNFLINAYWSKNIPFSIVKNSVENSFCFGVYYKSDQVGFARLITDFTSFAYLADVFILEEFRGKGLSKWLMKTIIDFPELQSLRGWMLKTTDAHELYKKFGFTSPKFPEKIMELSKLPNGYSNN